MFFKISQKTGYLLANISKDWYFQCLNDVHVTQYILRNDKFSLRSLSNYRNLAT